MINLNLETTNPEKLTTQAITEEVSNLWEELIKLEMKATVLTDASVELDKYDVSNNLYNEMQGYSYERILKVMTDRIEERISDLDDMLVVRTWLSYTLTDEAKEIKFKMLKEATKNTLLHESVFDFLY